jgi:AcrR family transcriptional regulator
MDASTDDAHAAFPAPPPVDLEGLDTHDRIVRAALEVFVEKGYSGTRVQDIAERAGLTAGALYVHFPNRSKLLAEAVVLEGDRIIASIIGQLGGVELGENRLAVIMADQVIAETSLIDRLLLEAFALAAREPEALDQFRNALDRFEDMIRTQLAISREAGIVAPDLDDDAIVAFMSAWILGLVVYRGVDRPRPPLEGIVRVSGRVLDGLEPRG